MARILVVEDEAIAALEMKETLERLGNEVPAVISSGDEVLGAALKHKPDLVVMDIHLRSFIDGIDAAERLKMLGRIPIIYVTAYPSADIRERASKTNPKAYLLKPVSDKDFADAVQAALDGDRR
jgi:CheY-like chemotaxis protein